MNSISNKMHPPCLPPGWWDLGSTGQGGGCGRRGCVSVLGRWDCLAVVITSHSGFLPDTDSTVPLDCSQNKTSHSANGCSAGV